MASVDWDRGLSNTEMKITAELRDDNTPLMHNTDLQLRKLHRETSPDELQEEEGREKRKERWDQLHDYVRRKIIVGNRTTAN